MYGKGHNYTEIRMGSMHSEPQRIKIFHWSLVEKVSKN